MAGRSIGDLGESGNSKNGDRMAGLSNKSSFENPDEGFRVLNEANNVLVGETHKTGESSFEEMMEWDNDFMLDLIGKDLDLRYGCVDNEVRGGNGSRGNNLVEDLNPWNETVGNATNKQGTLINENAFEGLDLVNPACPRKGQYLIANTFSPDEVVGFVNFVATHPSREVGALLLQKKVELNAFNRWRGRNHLPSLVEEFGELVDEKGGRSDYEKVNQVQSSNKRSRRRPQNKKKRVSSMIPY